MSKLLATIPATIFAALLFLSQTAFAAGPIDVSGTLPTGTTTVTSVRHAGGVTFYDQTVTGSIAGSVTGTYSLVETVIVFPSGEFGVHGWMTCTCTVSGASGMLQLRLDANGEADGSFEGPFTVISGTGGLANLHGHGTFQGGTGIVSTYSGQVIFAP